MDGLRLAVDEGLQTVAQMLETSSKTVMIIPQSTDDKIRTGWNVYLRTYAAWCRDNKTAYDAKKCGAQWKALSAEEKKKWDIAGGNIRKRPTKAAARVPTDGTKKPTVYNCSSFFHKFVAGCANPAKKKGETPDMIVRSELWKIE